MDTDYLTPMAYECLWYAADATDVLKSELGTACSRFKTEDEYLKGILKHVKEIESNPEDYLDWGNLLDDTDVKAFERKIRTLIQHIEKTIETSVKDRGKPDW